MSRSAGCSLSPRSLLAGPGLFVANSLSVLTQFLSLLVIALMWNLLAGYADIVSVGQQGFVGVGAYAFFGFTVFAHLTSGALLLAARPR